MVVIVAILIMSQKCSGFVLIIETILFSKLYYWNRIPEIFYRKRLKIVNFSADGKIVVPRRFEKHSVRRGGTRGDTGIDSRP